MGKKLLQMGNEATPFGESQLTHSIYGHLCLYAHTPIYTRSML